LSQLKDLTRLKQPGKAGTGLVQISFGVHSLEAAIAGQSVGEVRQAGEKRRKMAALLAPH
jgi:hypothetical protein